MKNLTKREMDIMRILWDSEVALLASEIANLDSSGSVHSIQTVLKSLLKKELVAVDEIVYSKNVLARRFKPIVTSETIEKNALENLFGCSSTKELSLQKLLSAFLPRTSPEETLEELNKLEELLAHERQKLLDQEKQELLDKEN